MFNSFFTAIWFFLPAGISNSTPVFAAKIPFLKSFNQPVDFALTFRGRRLLGTNKTFRGFIGGMIFGNITGLIQYFFFLNLNLGKYIDIDYDLKLVIILSSLLSFGSLFGDSFKSFFKRQFDVKPGEAWFPFDQIDYIIGGIVFTLPVIQLTLITYIFLMIFWFVVHPISTVIGYLIGVKDKPI